MDVASALVSPPRPLPKTLLFLFCPSDPPPPDMPSGESEAIATRRDDRRAGVGDRRIDGAREFVDPERGADEPVEQPIDLRVSGTRVWTSRRTDRRRRLGGHHGPKRDVRAGRFRVAETGECASSGSGVVDDDGGEGFAERGLDRRLEHVGLPEAQLNLSQAAIHLATAPKSNRAALAIWNARQAVRDGALSEVPAHLRDAHYQGASPLGHGVGYEYPHDHASGWVDQSHVPSELVGQRWYEPSEHGDEVDVARRMRNRDELMHGSDAARPDMPEQDRPDGKTGR